MEKGGISFAVHLDHKDLYRDLAKIKSAIEKLKADIAKKESSTNAIAEQLKAAKDEADAAQGAVESLVRQLEESVQKIDSLKARPQENLENWEIALINDQIKEQENLQTELNKKLDEAEKKEEQTFRAAEKLQAQYDKQLATLNEQKAVLAEQEKIQEQTQTKLAKAQAIAPVQEAIAGAEKTVNRFTRTLSNSLRRVFFFSLFYTGFRQIRDGMIATIKTNDEAVKAIARLKGAFLTLVNPLVNAVTPAVVAFTNALSTALEMLAELVSFLFGKTARESADAAKALYDEANGLNEVKEAAEEAEGSLASFDEINALQTEKKDTKSGKEDETIQPDFGAFNESQFKSAFDRFRAMLVTGIALLVIGAVLTFTGVNIPVGIAMMVAGAAMIYRAVALNWDSMDGPTKEHLALLVAAIGLFIAVIGVILCFTGNIALGVGLILAGVYIFGIGAAAMQWDSLGDTLKEKLSAVIKAIGIALIVIGIILLFVPGHLALGIGMIVAGVAALEVVDILLNWDSLGETLKEKAAAVIDKIGKTLIIIGILLLFVPGQLLLGLGLIVAGAAALEVEDILLNWESLGDTLEEKLWAVVDKIAKFMIIFGILLLFIPTKRALGVGMIVTGAAILAAKEIAPLWESFGDTIEEKLNGVLKIIKWFMIVVGLLLLFVPGFKPMGIGLIVGGIGILATQAITGSYALDEETKQKLGEILLLVSTMMLALGVVLLLIGGAPLLPVAIGLIAGGVSILGAGVIAPNWTYLLNMFRQLWQGIKNWWRTDAAKYFTLDYWKNKAADIINGFVSGIRAGISRVGQAISDLFSGGGASTSVTVTANTSAASPTATRSAAVSAYPTITAEQVPALARGAVIPANREFLAVLGDQKSGRNIEAPEGLLRQIQQEGNAEIVAVLYQIANLIREGQTIQVNGEIFGRTVQRSLNGITARSGKFALDF